MRTLLINRTSHMANAFSNAFALALSQTEAHFIEAKHEGKKHTVPSKICATLTLSTDRKP